jgi:hypothetical protein
MARHRRSDRGCLARGAALIRSTETSLGSRPGRRRVQLSQEKEAYFTASDDRGRRRRVLHGIVADRPDLAGKLDRTRRTMEETIAEASAALSARSTDGTLGDAPLGARSELQRGGIVIHPQADLAGASRASPRGVLGKNASRLQGCVADFPGRWQRVARPTRRWASGGGGAAKRPLNNCRSCGGWAPAR